MRQEKWAEIRIAFDPKSNGRHSNDLNNTGGVVGAKPDLHFEMPALLAVWRLLQGRGSRQNGGGKAGDMVITLARERSDRGPGDGGRWTSWQELPEVKSTGLGDVLSIGVEGVDRVKDHPRISSCTAGWWCCQSLRSRILEVWGR